MRVDVNASPQVLEIFLAPDGKPLPEAQVAATICRMEFKRLSMI